VGEFSLTHWLVILVIVLIFFGPSKLPGLGSSLGKAIRGFKAGMNDPDPEETAAQNRKTEQLPGGAAQQTAQQTAKEKDPNHQS
jgi:TatA/E family protein of Tat protein translocase